MIVIDPQCNLYFNSNSNSSSCDSEPSFFLFCCICLFSTATAAQEISAVVLGSNYCLDHGICDSSKVGQINI